MMQLTEEQRKALIEECQAVIEYGGYPSPSIYEIALASLTAEPVVSASKKSVEEILSGDLKCSRVWSSDADWGDSQPAFKLYTAPPVAALRLPDEKSTDIDYAYYPLTKARHEGWNACLAEVKRLNASAPEENQIDYQIEYRISQVKAWVSVTKETYDKAGRNVKKRIVHVVEQNK